MKTAQSHGFNNELGRMETVWSDGTRTLGPTLAGRAAMVYEVASLVGYGDGSGDLGIIVEQALTDDPDATAEDIAEIVREARQDAADERDAAEAL